MGLKYVPNLYGHPWSRKGQKKKQEDLLVYDFFFFFGIFFFLIFPRQRSGGAAAADGFILLYLSFHCVKFSGFILIYKLKENFQEEEWYR